MKNTRQAHSKGLVPKGSVLFHGSIEKFSETLRPGGDGVIWFADQPSIAQLYIPKSGLSLTSSPRSFVKPNKDVLIQRVQAAIGIEYDLSKVTFNRHNEPSSWPSPKGWSDLPKPTEIERRIEALGYEKNRYGSYEFRFHEGELLSGKGMATGQLIIAKAKEDLRIWNRANREGDLTDLQYNNIKSFRDAEKAGYDGVIINDFAQSEEWGNLGHHSLGLFRGTMKKLQTKSVPAPYREWDRSGKTPEYPKAVSPWLHKLGSDQTGRVASRYLRDKIRRHSP